MALCLPAMLFSAACARHAADIRLAAPRPSLHTMMSADIRLCTAAISAPQFRTGADAIAKPYAAPPVTQPQQTPPTPPTSGRYSHNTVSLSASAAGMPATVLPAALRIAAASPQLIFSELLMSHHYPSFSGFCLHMPSLSASSEPHSGKYHILPVGH